MTAIKFSNSFAHAPGDLHPFNYSNKNNDADFAFIALSTKMDAAAGWSTVKSAAFNYCVLMELVSPATAPLITVL
jgi:hypothetical protein